jgi:hypothetical protein
MVMVRDTMEPAAFVSWLQRSGPLLRVPRSRLVIAQATALSAMALCYFLAPQFAWGYSVVAVTGYVALALPALASRPRGVAGQRLMDASPGRQYLPGGTGYAIRLAGTLLVAFALPAAVAGVLPSPISERSADPWIAVACLLGTSGVVVAASYLAGPQREGVVSVLIAASAFIFLVAALSFSALPLLPGLPGFKPA